MFNRKVEGVEDLLDREPTPSKLPQNAANAGQDLRDPDANNGERNIMPPTGRPGKRVFIETYGCQMNLADSELMGGILATRGYEAAKSLEEADVILINTCAVREKAEERVYGRLGHLMRLKNKNPDLVLGVTGCMAEHLRESITERAPYVDVVLGPDAYRRLPELLEETQEEYADTLIDVKLDRTENYEGFRIDRQKDVNAWVTIQRGCDKFCTFCIVPYTRGRERGVMPEEVLRQVKECAEQGFKEITLLGQTVNSYKWTEGGTPPKRRKQEQEDPENQPKTWDFADLLEEVVKIDGIERIRFTSPYPTDFTDKLIDTIARHDKISKYIHLPAQSGSDDVLGVMKRMYCREDFDKLVARIRAKIPNIAMSTDIIVGFPGETEEDFEATLDLMEQVRFDFAYLFAYSERHGTYASRRIEDTITEDVKGRRLATIIERQEEISAEIFQSRIGTIQEVLVVGESKRNAQELCGRTDDFKMTVFSLPDERDGAASVTPGDIVKVKITGATSRTLLGEFVSLGR